MANTPSWRVALTGGIASGKTAVANEFAALGAATFDTDQISRDIVEPGTPALTKIVAHFGTEILDSTGHLDRRRMRDLIFADPAQRQNLEAITHPAIRVELARRAAIAKGPYQVHVIPLLVESGGANAYDRILLVDCPEEVQLARLTQRDRCDELQARRILAAQATREARLAVANDVIANTGSLAELQNRVRELHIRYLALAAKNISQPV